MTSLAFRFFSRSLNGRTLTATTILSPPLPIFGNFYENLDSAKSLKINIDKISRYKIYEKYSKINIKKFDAYIDKIIIKFAYFPKSFTNV